MNEIPQTRTFAESNALNALEEASEAVLNAHYQSVLADDFSADPAERIDFVRPPGKVIPFDGRSNDRLKETARFHEDKMERERALWEFALRQPGDEVAFVSECLRSETDVDVRSAGLWLLQKVSGDRATDQLSNFIVDSDIEVRDWAHLLLRETTGTTFSKAETRRAAFCEENPFDQTLPLKIAGFARTHVPGMGWVQATLSPLWFESIMGRVMACTCTDTFDSRLVIEKEIKEYHPDGSDHYEIYNFSGTTFRINDRISHHIYNGVGHHTFYPSGKVEHPEEKDPVGDAVVGAARSATAILVPRPLAVDGSERAVHVAQRAVQSVRGVYMGLGYANPERILAQGMKIGPGEVQLIDPHHPRIGKLTNTFLSGTFKGKLSDLNGDGLLDINTERCHATIDGGLDYRLLGSENPDPFDPLSRTR